MTLQLPKLALEELVAAGEPCAKMTELLHPAWECQTNPPPSLLVPYFSGLFGISQSGA